MNKIVVNETEDKILVALLQDGELVEKYQNDEEFEKLEGNIYCGIVKKVLSGMQSAFVDIGEKKNAFIHIKDILPKMSNETGNKDEKFEKYDVRDYIKENETILVQVKKDRESKKGAYISKHISMTGRYVIFMPGENFITVSKKIEDQNRKDELKRIVKDQLKKNNLENSGAIVRTAASTATEEDIAQDLKNLINTWKKVEEKYKKVKEMKKPIKICEAQDIVTKLIIGVANQEECKIVANTEELYEKAKKITKDFSNKEIYIELDENNIDDDLKDKLEKAEERKIWLKCGGFITIDKTEALTAIDVNSGKYTGGKNNKKDQNLLKVNLEATIEIAKQLRLKNVGGIIVIDYIDMEEEKDRKEIVELLEKELKKDRSKTQIVGFTKLDLLEVTRKRM